VRILIPNMVLGISWHSD